MAEQEKAQVKVSEQSQALNPGDILVWVEVMQQIVSLLRLFRRQAAAQGAPGAVLSQLEDLEQQADKSCGQLQQQQ